VAEPPQILQGVGAAETGLRLSTMTARPWLDESLAAQPSETGGSINRRAAARRNPVAPINAATSAQA
jgi:hypothetical protein